MKYKCLFYCTLQQKIEESSQELDAGDASRGAVSLGLRRACSLSGVDTEQSPHNPSSPGGNCY